MSNIVFLEIEPDDKKEVQTKYRKSLVLPGKLQDKGVPERCKNAEILSTFIYSQLKKKDLDTLPKLKLVAARSVGYDHIDMEECKRRGIVVCNVPDYGSHVIAEHVFALLLSALRHVAEADDRVEGGTFDYHGLRGMALRGKTIGIVGTGKIGKNVAKIAHGFGMKILAVDRCRIVELEKSCDMRYVSLPELLCTSDIITLHIPESKETHHLIDARAFASMKPGAILVNTARGSLIDSSAMLKALESGTLAYALLDVLEHEQNFTENKELICHPHVVTTPHIAFYADDSMRNMYTDAFQSIERWMAGKEPEHVVR